MREKTAAGASARKLRLIIRTFHSDVFRGVTMRTFIPEMSRKAVPTVADWIRRQSQRTILCRECDWQVNLSEKVCPRCGASDPARIPWSAVTAIFAIIACLIIAAIVFLT
jgi:uncharacterized paraquat-inducible protein A